jgi:hypothetical protein
MSGGMFNAQYSMLNDQEIGVGLYLWGSSLWLIAPAFTLLFLSSIGLVAGKEPGRSRPLASQKDRSLGAVGTDLP